jgi:CBS domain-containing protein
MDLHLPEVGYEDSCWSAKQVHYWLVTNSFPASWERDRALPQVESPENTEEGSQSMKVKDLMMGAPCYCQPETNLGSATELMWNANCGCLPVVSADGKVSGIITDRDICVALGTRNRVAGEVTVGEVISGKVHSCGPEDDVHLVLQTLKEAKVRRLPVVSQDGSLVGILSMDDLLSHAEPSGFGAPELSSDEVIRTFRSIMPKRPAEFVLTRSATA